MVRIEALGRDPFPPQSIKLSGSQRLYRIRAGDYRIIYEADSQGKSIIIHYIRHRRDGTYLDTTKYHTLGEARRMSIFAYTGAGAVVDFLTGYVVYGASENSTRVNEYSEWEKYHTKSFGSCALYGGTLIGAGIGFVCGSIIGVKKEEQSTLKIDPIYENSRYGLVCMLKF